MIGSRVSTCARAMAAAAVLFLFGANAFAQTCPTATPRTPAANATVTGGSKVHYQWTLSTANNVTGYAVLVRQAGNGTPQADCTSTAANDTCDGSILPAGNYEYEVRTFSQTCPAPGGADSSLVPFTVAAVCNAPSAPTLISPANNATVTANPPTLNWSAVSNITRYDIHIGTSLFSSTTNSFTPQTLAPGTYSWFVEAIASCDGSKKTQSTATFTFTVSSCPDAVTLQSPAENTSVPSGSVTLTWKTTSANVTTASTYNVFAGIDGGTPVFIGSTTTTSLTRNMDASKSIEWYVVTTQQGCPDKTSARGHFTTVLACPQTQTTLRSPGDGAKVSLPVTFDWDDVPNATSYNLYVITPTRDEPLNLVGTTSKSEFTATTLPSGATSWFVQATAAGCTPTESAHNAITILAGNCPTNAATLISPANNSTVSSNTVDFDWSDVAGASGYRLVVSFNDGSATPIGAPSDSHFSANLPAGTYTWHVDALFGTSCPSTTSSSFTFTVPAAQACTTTPPTIVSPADGTTGLTSPVTLQWSAVTGATAYKVFASTATTSTAQIGDATTSTSLTAQFPAGTINWFVEAILSGDCAPVVSKRASFTVATGTCNNSAPVLQSPSDNATNVTSPVKFQWQRASGATIYTLFVSYNGGTFFQFGQTTDSSAERIIPAGTVAWYVVASFTGCPDQQSSTFHFTIPQTSCPTGSITLTSPANGATVASPVTLTWSALAGATSYRVNVSSNGAAFVTVAHPDTNSATVALPSGSVDWYVEALFTGNTATNTCPSIQSSTGRFTVQRAASCDNNKAAVGVSPSGSITTKSVTFNWNAAAGATAYRVWLAPAGQPFGDLGLTKNTQIARDLDPGAYTWYVDTFFDGCPTLSSDKLTFTITTARCSDAITTLISPANGATSVTSPVTLLWSAVGGAQKYRVFALTDNSTSAILAGETTDTSLTKSVLPGTIRWFVETIFDGCPSTRSGISTFTVPRAQNCSGDAAQLVAPANGATVSNGDVDLVWNAVNGAKRYVVFVRHNDGAPTAIDETEDTHRTIRPPDGKIEWWIVTFVTGCDPTESTHFSFTVTTPNNCDNKKPLLQSPKDDTVTTSPVVFNWTAVANATGYRVFAFQDGDEPSLVDSTTTATKSKPTALPTGIIHWFVEATFANCPVTRSAVNDFRVIAPPSCGTPARPLIGVAPTVASDTLYTVRWTPVPNADKFELQESVSADFASPATFITSDTFLPFTHSAATAPVQYLYRVRAISDCNDDRSAFSNVIGVIILPPKQNGTTDAGSTTKVVTKVFLPGGAAPLQFSAHGDKPWITVEPSSGTLPTAGITLTVTADPGPLNLGTNTGTILISYTSTASGRSGQPMVTVASVPVSVSLVTPVQSGGKNTPPPDSLIVPAVGHATGIGNSLFESDVRLANASAQLMKYSLNFTPAQTDGTITGSSTQIQVDPGATMALDDILANFFGAATTGAVGTLEIRPLTSTTATGAFTSTTPSQSLTTVVSSRTYNATATGTFGQFIPAIPFAQFIANVPGAAQKQILSLQQVANSSAYRTNVGIVEGAGEPVSVLLSVFDAAGNRLGQIPETIPAGGFIQFNNLLGENGITVDDGRIEVEVTSTTGRVTAYASVLDNITSDPLLVSPVAKLNVGSNRYALPGIGDFDIGIAHWKSDVRIYNAGSTRADATLSYYPQGAPGSPRTTTISIDPGEMKVMNDFIASTFPSTGTAGSLVVSTPTASSLVATARTYTDQGSNKGTYGQFIPAVTPAESTGLGGRTLQVLQLEASDKFRANIGLVETSGAPVSVEVSVILPDSRVTPKTTYNLAANEFRQISLGADFGLSNVYNVRTTVRVLSGTGKVTAYGSVIDATTQDPTYVPAQ